ncbi:hypothetical protein CR513_34568, partial [Mucuna pruriens]
MVELMEGVDKRNSCVFGVSVPIPPNFNIQDGLHKLPSSKNQFGQHSPSNSMDGKISRNTTEFGNGKFSSYEVKKIMENDKQVEIASTDPKRAKRSNNTLLN